MDMRRSLVARRSTLTIEQALSIVMRTAIHRRHAYYTVAARLRLECKQGEHRLVDAPQRLALDGAFPRLHAQRVLAEGQRALAPELL
jgi:hypothetical protein